MFANLIVVLAVLLVVRAYTPSEQIIQDHLSTFSQEKADTLCTKNKCCTMSASESCSMANMPQDQSMLVLPGGETRCIFSTSTPFAFQVVPGAKDKLLFYFQGGGACWTEETTVKAPLCTTDVSPQSLVGVFDRTNTNNAFKDYTVVHVSYCSGDVHGGDVTQSYSDSAGQPVKQKGVANAQSALDWVKAQVKSGALASTFSELVVMGCSAGSIGAQLWGKQVTSQLKWKTAAVVPDSYAGIFPDGTMGPLIYSFGYCKTELVTSSTKDKCNAQTLTLQDIDSDAMSAIPSVPFAFIQSKTDIVQQSFYVSVGVSMNASSKAITPTEFYNDVNNVFGDYSSKHPNFVTYLVNGDHHCFTNQDLYYDADTLGPHGATQEEVSQSLRGLLEGQRSTSSAKMYSWTNNYPLSEGESVSTACDGDVQSKEEIEKQLRENNLRTMSDNTYCSTKVVPKSYTEHY